MEDLNDKVTGSATPLTAAEWNQIPSEQQNTITTSGQTLSGDDLTQLAKAIAHYMASGTFYTDSGTADAYVLAPIDNNLNPPAKVDGMEVEFIVGNTNTGLSTLVLDGLSSSLITDSGGNPGLLTAGDIVRMRYDGGTNAYTILGKSSTVTNLKVADYLSSTAADILDRPWLLAAVGVPDVSRTTYAELFAKIGTSFGAGDGSSTFGLPPLDPLTPAVTTNVGSWVDQALGNSPTDSRGIAVEAFNGDVWVVDTATSDVYKSDGGTAAFVSTGDFTATGDTTPSGIAVDSATGDVFVVGQSTDTIYKSLRGIEDFAAIGTYPGTLPKSVAVNTANGDVWVTDTGTTPATVYVLKRGDPIGTFVETGGYTDNNVNGIAVNPGNGDVWVGGTTSMYKSTGGVAAFTSPLTYNGSLISGIAIDPNNNNVWVADSTDDDVYLSTGGETAFVVVGTYPGILPEGIAVLPSTGDLWIVDSNSNTVYQSAGSVAVAAVEWYINHGTATPVATVLASVVTQNTGTSQTFNITLLGTGDNRGILAAITINEAAEQFPSDVTIDGVSGTLVYSESFTNTVTSSFAVFYWDDSEHPGTGTVSLDITATADSVAVSVLELNDVIQTSSQVISSIVTATISDVPTSTSLDTTLPNEAGKLGVDFFAAASAASSAMSFTESANLADENFADATDCFTVTWEDLEIDSASEDYAVVYTLDSGAVVDATIYGAFAINGLASGIPLFTLATETVVQSASPESSEKYGIAVAVSGDGQTSAVGANERNNAGTDQGLVYVYTRTGVAWAEEDTFTASDIQDGDEFGSAVALSDDGDVLVATSPFEAAGGADAGAIYLFSRSGSVWTQEDKLINAVAGDRFGTSADVSGDGLTCIAGSPFSDFGGTERGTATVFEFSGGSWNPEQQLQSDDIGDGDRFGQTVALSQDGDTCIVGAYLESSNGASAGAAYVFTRTAGVWTQQQKLVSDAISTGDFFGYSVDLADDGDTCVVGAIGDEGTGVVYLFTRSAGVWTQQAALADAEADFEFGQSVGISGDGLIAFGSSGSISNLDGSFGDLFTFREDSGAWTLQQQVAAVSQPPTGLFGGARAADISTDGETIVVGSQGVSPTDEAMYVYTP